jgi:diaminopimelate epimerase
MTKTHHALLTLGLCINFVLLDTGAGQQPEKAQWVRQDLYDDGNAAYAAGNGVSALEKFFAFREFNKQQLESAKGEQEQKVRDDLNRTIEKLELTMTHAVEHDKYHGLGIGH